MFCGIISLQSNDWIKNVKKSLLNKRDFFLIFYSSICFLNIDLAIFPITGNSGSSSLFALTIPNIIAKIYTAHRAVLKKGIVTGINP